MSVATASPRNTARVNPSVLNGRVSSQLLAQASIFLLAFTSAFVIFEPAPYDLLLPAFSALFLIGGLRLSQHSIILAAIFIIFNFGGLLAMFVAKSIEGIPMYLAVSVFLAISSVFWCAVIEADYRRLTWLFRGYVIGAVITSIAGIIGYFGALPGFGAFTLYDRAKGVFQDPNVFGPFLVAPVLYLVYGIFYGTFTRSLIRIPLLGIILFGLFLSFSRGAWGLTVISALIFYFLLLATETNLKQRFSLIAWASVGVVALVFALIIAVQFDSVSDMLSERAKVVQDYDGARLGRFARHWIGFAWALENPLGIGAFQLGLTLGEDPHNIWLKSLMAYGWLGFAAWMTMTVTTLVGGARILGRDRPWKPFLFCAWSIFLGHQFLGWVIDLDHWRHVYLLVGIIWGCMALEARYQRERRLASPAARRG